MLRHVRGLLKPGGRLLLTPECRGRSAATAVLDRCGALTAGCGRLPESSEPATQLETAGLTRVTARSLIPGESFYAFVGAGLR